MTPRFTIALLCALLLGTSVHAQFSNGSFALPGMPGLGNCDGGTGWTPSPWPKDPEYTAYPSLADFHIDLTPCHQFGNGVWIEQTVATTPGACYRLRLDLGTLCGWDGSDAGVYVRANGVQVGGRVYNDSFICLPDTVCWKTRWSESFTATGAATTIRLVGEGRLSAVSPSGPVGAIGNPGYIGVDNVALIPAALGPGGGVQLGRDTTVCGAVSFLLDAGVADVYRWSTGDSTRTITVKEPGVYWVAVMDFCSGSASDTILINSKAAPAVSIPEKLEGCAGMPLALSATASVGASLQWSTGATTPAILAETAGAYWVQATNDCGTASDTTLVSLVQPPAISLPPAADLCGLATLTLHPAVSGPAALRWSTGDTAAELIVGHAGSYALVAANDCGSDTAATRVTDCPADVWLPNAFTPDNDGLNDVLKPTLQHSAELLTFAVFDRWGEEVFTASGALPSWDGRYRGQPAPVGTYYYLLRYRGRRGEAVTEKKGDVLLVR